MGHTPKHRPAGSPDGKGKHHYVCGVTRKTYEQLKDFIAAQEFHVTFSAVIERAVDDFLARREQKEATRG